MPADPNPKGDRSWQHATPEVDLRSQTTPSTQAEQGSAGKRDAGRSTHDMSTVPTLRPSQRPWGACPADADAALATRAKLERQALDSFTAEFAKMPSCWSRPLTAQERQSGKNSVPTKASLEAFFERYCAKLDGAAFKDCEAECTEEMLDACMSYRRKAESSDGSIYSLPSDAYGHYEGVATRRGATMKAQALASRASETCINKVTTRMRRNWTQDAAFASFPDGRAKVERMLNEEEMSLFELTTAEGWNPGPPFVATGLRGEMCARYMHLSTLRSSIGQLRNIEQRCLARRAAAGGELIKSGAATGSLLLEIVFATVDQAKPLIDRLEVNDAIHMNQVLRGARYATKEGNGDTLVLDMLRERLPHLHIHVVEGTFPHKLDAVGAGAVYADKQIGLCLSVVTPHLRSALREKRLAERYAPPRTNEEAQAMGARLRANPELTRAGVDAERHEQLVRDGYDFGTNVDEEWLFARDADLGHPNTFRSSAKPRRVKDNGWHKLKIKPNDEMYTQTNDPTKIWHAPPKLSITLINADTNEPVVPGHDYGGLVPERRLKAMGAPHLVANSGGTWPAHRHSQMFGRDYQTQRSFSKIPDGLLSAQQQRQPRFLDDARPTTFAQATLCKFWPKCLASEQQGARFKIRVTAKGIMHMRLQGEVTSNEVALTAETAPITFYSNSRSKSTARGGKRKVSDEAGPSSARKRA